MCNPAVAAGVAIGGQVLGMAGQYWGNQIQANASAAQAELSAKLKEREAAEIGRAGRIAVARLRVQGRQAEASQRAGYGGSGVDVNVGTPADVQTNTGTMAEVDASELKRKYDMERWASLSEAKALRHGVELQRKYGWISGATTVLGGVSSVAGTYADYRAANPKATQEMTTTTQSSSPYRQYYDKKKTQQDWSWG